MVQIFTKENVLQKFIDKLIDWYLRLFMYEDTSKPKKITLPKPDFDDMINWEKIDIDLHAEQYGIFLDRRKSPENMIEDYRKAYAEWLEIQKNG